MESNIFARWKGIVLAAIATLLLFLVYPGEMEAHSALIKSSPAANSRLTASPETVSLTFNEPLEPELFSIKVLDSSGQSVTSNKARISDDHSGLVLDLPPLEDGVYTVSFKVISADGHPIGSSYVFSVGNVGGSPDSAVMPAVSTGGGLSFPMSFGTASIFLTRILYYMSLLGLAGWIFWGLFGKNDIGTTAAAVNRKWTGYLQCGFLLAFLLMALSQMRELLDQWSLQSLKHLLTGTTIGYSWFAIAALSIIGFLVLSRSKWLDTLWIALLLVAESINGHAIAFKPKTDLLIMDWVHLLAASIWVGGLLYIIVHWRKRREEALRFLPRFSGWALSSLLLLVMTGAVMALAFLPKLYYVFYSQWGILLLCKIGLVLAVIVIGALLRWRMRKIGAKQGALLITDFLLMIIITIVVGLFTYLNPTPVNEPLYWHEIGAKAHMTTEITPNAPGNNDFYVQVWMPEDISAPKQVLLRLTSKNDEDMPPIDVPLKSVDLNEKEQRMFAGYRVFGYDAEGPYLPFPGKWEAEVRIMDANDDETVYKRQMTVY